MSPEGTVFSNSKAECFLSPFNLSLLAQKSKDFLPLRMHIQLNLELSPSHILQSL